MSIDGARSGPLTGKVVLVTGAARGIGAHTARLAAARGARLALVGLEADRLAALAAELGPGHVWFPADVTDQVALRAAADGTVAALGGIDAVVANAGVANRGTIAVGDIEALVRTVEVNLVGVMRTAAATVEALAARRGYLLIVSSAAAFAALPGMAAYCASKAGVEHFGTAIRLELAHRGWRWAPHIRPGWTPTWSARPGRTCRRSPRRWRSCPGRCGAPRPSRRAPPRSSGPSSVASAGCTSRARSPPCRRSGRCWSARSRTG